MSGQKAITTPKQYHVVIVLGKKLIRDQITVELATRVHELVKQLKAKKLKPDLVCFTGGKQPGGLVSEAVAGYTYFRQLCERDGVETTSFEFYLDEHAKNSIENIRNVLAEVKRRLGGTAGQCRFTLVSSDYHLRRLDEVHYLTSQQSLLSELEQAGLTWDYVQAPYPFHVSADPVTAWLAKINLLRDELTFVRVNLEGVLGGRESLLAENVNRLADVASQLQASYDTPPNVGNDDVQRARAALKRAIPLLGQCHKELGPLVNCASLDVTKIQRVERLLYNAIHIIKAAINPDAPLKWGEQPGDTT